MGHEEPPADPVVGVVEVVSGVVEEKPRKPGTFVPGDPRRKQAMEASEVRKEPESARDPLLTAYRAVLANPQKFDRGGLEKSVRLVWTKDRKAFLAKYQELELEERRELQAERAVEAVDQGERVSRALIARLLDRWQDEGKYQADTNQG